METKTLNYVRGGESFAVTLRPYVPDFYDKAVAVRADDNNWFTPLVDSNSSLASHIRINDNGTTLALSTNPDIICNSDRESVATACTLVTEQYDFGSLNPDGTEYFQNMASVKATQANSTIYGNSKSNYFMPVGGDENFFAGSFGLDTYRLHNSSALIVDFGIGTLKHGDGSLLATSISDETYNRFDTGSYGDSSKDRLFIYGSVTGIFFDYQPEYPNTYGKDTCVVDVAVTYTDENGNAQVVLLPAIRKNPTKTGSNPSYDSNYNSLEDWLITEIVDGTSTVLDSTAKKALAHEWADFPAELRQKLLRLYDIYDQSDFYCSAVDEESVHQSVPDELRYPTRDDNPIDMLDGRTLNGIKNIFKKGLGSTYFRTGDYFDITIPTRVALLSGGVIDAGSTWRVVLLGIDHNADIEGYNRGHFAIGRNTDNVDIAFYEYEFNSTATNAGGWGASKLRTWLNSTFYDALPDDLKAVISPCDKYSNNVGGGETGASAYTITSNNIWVMAAGEIYSFSPDAAFLQIYDYYKSGNSFTRYQHNAPSTATEYLTRSVLGNSSQIRVRRVGSWGNGNADTNFGFVPCFTIGGESD